MVPLRKRRIARRQRRPTNPSGSATTKSRPDRRRAERRLVQPSQNVINLQRRAAGVLPVRIDVPRAGTSHQFVKPLVVDAETIVAFRYTSGGSASNE